MGERHSEYGRDAEDWYVEPAWCVHALTESVEFYGDIHDPCCGSGTIPMCVNGTGADITDRGFGYPVTDFFRDVNIYDNIVTNPPYRIGQEIITHALAHARYRVAALVQVKFLASQKRHGLFTRPETEKVIMFSRRPSMPPGQELQKHGERIRGNGSIDFCWVVWRKRYIGPCTIEWFT